MNKIFPKRDLSLICIDYVDFVEPKVRRRLNILIGFLLLKEGNTIDLNCDSFTYKGESYSIGSNTNEKKGILNSFFTKNGKSQRITLKSGVLQLPNLTDPSIIKSGIRPETMESATFINLSKELKVILSQEINISRGSYLDNSMNYCRNLSKNEKLIFKEIFPYHIFFQEKDHDWYYASTLANELNTPVCPYCNREYISSVTSIKRTKVIGPTFDHFLSQKDYPFLKLSFYNLVPSCTTCNSRLKNQIEFDFNHFLYPFKESYEGIARFSLRLNNSEINLIIDNSCLIQEDKLSIRIKANPKNLKLYGTRPVRKKKGNLNVFKTEKIYNDSHKDVAFDILEKFQKMPKSQIESIFKVLKDQGKKHHEIYRFYFGNYLNEEDFNKRPLARMTRDIYNQLAGVYNIDFIDKPLENF